MSELLAKSPSGEKSWSSSMLEIYIEKKKPALPSYYLDELENAAREKLKDRRGERPEPARCRPPRAPLSSSSSSSHTQHARRIPLRLRQRGQLLR